METIKKKPLLSGLLILFLTAMIFANIGGNMYESLMPLYLKDLNASITQIGLFFTLAQVVPLLLQILGGWVSDTLGRLRAIAIGSVFGVLGFIPLILADTWQWLLLSVAIVFTAYSRRSWGVTIAAISDAAIPNTTAPRRLACAERI